ncbi:hypothetical protein JXJ21_07815 [candidate division KSB1 bacterium]|nr:hypothetical protein [candidate division KSB1 bacterium]
MKEALCFLGTCFLITCILYPAHLPAEVAKDGLRPDYLRLVQAYADALLENDRDIYGEIHSPLFAVALDRKTVRLDSFPDIEGIRNGDRIFKGANPMHDQNLYQILYALTTITGDSAYAREADRALTFFFENCQSPATGLMAWGEHIGWDFYNEAPCGKDCCHEFFRPWCLWERCYQLAPEACLRFARGLWEHQIHDQQTGEFSRHARWSQHQTGTQNEYPRHGGFYIMTWAKAYAATSEPLYARAVETLVDYFNASSSKISGAIRCSSNPKREKIMWPESNLSLAVDLTNSAPVFEESLRTKMLKRASDTDNVYVSLKHDFQSDGIGFVAGADIDSLTAFQSGEWSHTQLWATGYGKATDAQVANLCFLRYQQLAKGKTKTDYKELIIGSARRYLNSQPDLKSTIYPGPMGDVILHLLAAYALTGNRVYLDRADFFAGIAIDCFLTDGSPLPRASSQHTHYEAITRGDTMMMGLLQLWLIHNKPDLEVTLVYNDR